MLQIKIGPKPFRGKFFKKEKNHLGTELFVFMAWDILQDL